MNFTYRDTEEVRNDIIQPIVFRSERYFSLVREQQNLKKQIVAEPINAENHKSILKLIQKKEQVEKSLNDYQSLIFSVWTQFNCVYLFVEEKYRSKEFLVSRALFLEGDFQKSYNYISKKDTYQELKDDLNKKSNKKLRQILNDFVLLKLSLGELTKSSTSHDYNFKVLLANLVNNTRSLEIDKFNQSFTLDGSLISDQDLQPLIEKIKSKSFFDGLYVEASIYQTLGDLYMQGNQDLKKAISYLKKATQNLLQLVAHHHIVSFASSFDEILMELARAYRYLAHIYLRDRNHELASHFYQKDISLLRKLYRLYPQHYTYEFAQQAFYLTGFYANVSKDLEAADELAKEVLDKSVSFRSLYRECYVLTFSQILIYTEYAKTYHSQK